MATDQIKHLHILGICGTAMAAIACLAKATGWHVTGSDAGVYPPMSDYLASMDISIATFDVSNLEPAPSLVLIGNALSRGNVEVESVLNKGLPYTSGAAFTGDYILPDQHAIVVAGTHGKTTTSSLISHILHEAGFEPGFLIGGIPENFIGGARLGDGNIFVLEGDEYDTAFFDKRSKFLHYHARTLILNNLEYDHADIFPDLAAIETQFHHLIRTVPTTGHIIMNADDANLSRVLDRGCWTPLVSFAQRGYGKAEWQWETITQDGSHFRIWRDDALFLETTWNMIGIHHVANACAATIAAYQAGVNAAHICAALRSFKGVRRRMSLIGEKNHIQIYDDFAHHPTAIAGVVSAMKAQQQEKGRLWVVLEPRSNTMRTKVHEQRLPGSLCDADFVIFTPPSMRNINEDEALDVQKLCREIGDHACVLADATTIIQYLVDHTQARDCILILSNGGFDGIHKRLLQAL